MAQAKSQKAKPWETQGVDRQIPLKFIALGVLAIFVLLIVAVLLISLVSDPISGTKPSGIAVIPLSGEIFSGKDTYDGVLSSDEISELIKEAEDDPSISVILLDIDSPGGGVVASKQIVYKIREAKKSVYSYINSLGASGAYYAASASDYIMADEDSLTGSIGVISIFPNFTGLLEKIGVEVTILKEGKFKASGSEFKDLTAEEQELFQTLLSETYDQFRGDVLEFRGGKITPSDLDKVADGRILSGRQAYKVHLVDELLPKTKLLERIGELEKIENPNPIYYGEEGFTLADFFLSSGKALGFGIISSLKDEQKLQLK